jgi:hypothetical protein
MAVEESFVILQNQICINNKKKTRQNIREYGRQCHTHSHSLLRSDYTCSAPGVKTGRPFLWLLIFTLWLG